MEVVGKNFVQIHISLEYLNVKKNDTIRRNTLEWQDRIARFINHLPFKVKLFVKNATRRGHEHGSEFNM